LATSVGQETKEFAAAAAALVFHLLLREQVPRLATTVAGLVTVLNKGDGLRPERLLPLHE
jgi:hypothetical protein